MLSPHLLVALFCYGFLTIYSDIQIAMFNVLTVPLMDLYNQTLYNHYGIEADERGIAIVMSIMGVSALVGVYTCLVFIAPLVDSRGRKFVTVYLRFALGTIVAVCQISTFYTQAAELLLISQIGIGLTTPISFYFNTLYLTECAPDAHRGFVSTVILLSSLFSSIVIYIIGNPNVFGSEDNWVMIPIISLVLCCLNFIITAFLPESPKWLVARNRMEEARESVKKFHEKDVDINTVVMHIIKENETKARLEHLSLRKMFQEESIRTAVMVIIAAKMLQVLSAGGVEINYMVLIHTTLGLTSAQSMNLNLWVRIILAPLHFVGTTFMDKFGRRPVFYCASVLQIFKLVIMFAIHVYHSLGLQMTFVTYWILVLDKVASELIAATGYAALATLLINEILPPVARVPATQITFMSLGLIDIILLAFPTIYAIATSLYYMPLFIIQPLIIIFLYRNLPETKGRAVCDIVSEFDDHVKSRANTRLSALSETSELLPKHVNC